MRAEKSGRAGDVCEHASAFVIGRGRPSSPSGISWGVLRRTRANEHLAAEERPRERQRQIGAQQRRRRRASFRGERKESRNELVDAKAGCFERFTKRTIRDRKRMV